MNEDVIVKITRIRRTNSKIYNISLEGEDTFFSNGILTHNTPPHPVAAKHLIKWVRKRLGKQGKQALRTAYAVANSIKKRGMPPHPFLRPAIHEAENKYGIVIKDPVNV